MRDFILGIAALLSLLFAAFILAWLFEFFGPAQGIPKSTSGSYVPGIIVILALLSLFREALNAMDGVEKKESREEEGDGGR